MALEREHVTTAVSLTGKGSKAEAAEQFGDEQVHIWRIVHTRCIASNMDRDDEHSAHTDRRVTLHDDSVSRCF